jgi:hypothetical protein
MTLAFSECKPLLFLFLSLTTWLLWLLSFGNLDMHFTVIISVFFLTYLLTKHLRLLSASFHFYCDHVLLILFVL